MSLIEDALHVENIDGHRMRYFRSPVYSKSGTPDMPWHAVDDLWSAIGVEKDDRVQVLRSLRAGWIEPHTVANSDGIVVIQPFLMGDIIIDEWLSLNGVCLDDLGDASLPMRRIRGGFRRGNTAALKRMCSHLGAAGLLSFALTAADTTTFMRETN